MKLSQLQKRYPKAYYNFVSYFRKRQPKSMCQEVYEMMDRVKDYDVRGWWREITDFMDKEKLVIELRFDFPDRFKFIINYYEHGIGEKMYWHGSGFKNRKQAETQAIKEAFEILHERSKE